MPTTGSRCSVSSNSKYKVRRQPNHQTLPWYLSYSTLYDSVKNIRIIYPRRGLHRKPVQRISLGEFAKHWYPRFPPQLYIYKTAACSLYLEKLEAKSMQKRSRVAPIVDFALILLRFLRSRCIGCSCFSLSSSCKRRGARQHMRMWDAAASVGEGGSCSESSTSFLVACTNHIGRGTAADVEPACCRCHSSH